MVRPRDDEKRRAIIEAAIKVFAVKGISSTPTSAISKAAGVAEGTLFTYFETKDALINELYQITKQELADSMLSGLQANTDCRTTLKHVWESYLAWGLANPDKNRVLAQLKVSEKLTCETINKANGSFATIEKMITDAVANGEIRDYSCAYMGAIMASMADTTMAFMAGAGAGAGADPIDYRQIGFEVLWNGIAMPQTSNKKQTTAKQ